MGPVGSRRVRLVLLLIFILMCGTIAYSQWYAVHVNIPRYETHRSQSH
jgi:hypothetical protein